MNERIIIVLDIIKIIGQTLLGLILINLIAVIITYPFADVTLKYGNKRINVLDKPIVCLLLYTSLILCDILEKIQKLIDELLIKISQWLRRFRK